MLLLFSPAPCRWTIGGATDIQLPRGSHQAAHLWLPLLPPLFLHHHPDARLRSGWTVHPPHLRELQLVDRADTQNLTCLYAYNLRESEKDLSPLEIAVRRSTSVITGVIWAGVVSRYWWPYTARRELRMGLGE